MCKHLLLVAVLAAAGSLVPSFPAAAQGCGSNNPNCIVPMAPAGDASNRAASTLWVQQNAMGPGAGVSSWNGRSGVVVPAINDYDFTQIGPSLLGFNQMPPISANQVYMNTGTTVAGVTIPNCIGGQQSLLYDATAHTFGCNTVNPVVNSVFGRSGTVVSANGDYSFSQISGQTTFPQMPVASVNTVYGNISVPSALPMPVCNNPNQALQWVPGGGFGCAVVSGGGGGGGLPTINADSALGNPTNTASNLLTGMALPACTGSSNALQYSTGTHSFSCGTITAASPVTSVFTRTGAIVAQSGDYTFSQIGGTATLAQLPTATANSLLGGLSATAPSYLSVPSCSTANQALQWTTGTGFSCVTITAGTGTVQSFSAGNLSPLFTTSVASSTVNPALTFTLSNVAANTVFSNWTNSSVVAPQFNTMPSCSGTNQALNYTNGTGIGCITASGTPAGSNTQVQFNNSGAFGASPNLTWASPVLSVGSTGSTGAIGFVGSTSGTTTLQGPAVGNGTFVLPTGTGTNTLTYTVASGTAALGTSAIASAACATAVTVSATGVATTDVVSASFNGDPTAVTGYVPLTAGMLTIIPYPTANNVNFKVCNNTSASITPGAITLNWRVVR